MQSEGYLDAIVCDPPYGLRETIICHRSGITAEARQVAQAVAPTEMEQQEGGSESRLAGGDIMIAHLVSLAAEALVVGGRLVYWAPVEEVTQATAGVRLPACLQEVERCEQTLSRRKPGHGEATRKHKHAKSERGHKHVRPPSQQQGKERERDDSRVKRYCVVLEKTRPCAH